MTHLTEFKKNSFPTMGIELELQLIDLQDYDMAMEASDFLRRLSEIPIAGEFKPEITQAMIELNSSAHHSHHSLMQELRHMQTIVSKEAAKSHIGVCGGGAHPFQKWQEQRIYPTERFKNVSEHYGYLAKQFTVFAQHIHIGCQNGDDAIYLCHAIARFIPQFIALSAASPLQHAMDTSFDCSRLTVISAFPLSGTPPWMHTWQEFESYFNHMYHLGVIKSIKDFYWDVRPQPGFGTIELRICDTPLTIEKAADLAAYAQMLALWLIDTHENVSHDIYLTYLYNRFNAARYGLHAEYIDAVSQQKSLLADQILDTCRALEPYAIRLNSQESLYRIKEWATLKINDAAWIRNEYLKSHTLNDTVKSQVKLWTTIKE